MRTKTKITNAFLCGIKDGVPIALIYFVISFSFGIAVVNYGMPSWYATLISGTNLTSAGQFAGINMIFALSSYFEIAITILLINARYVLMGFSLSQQTDPSVSLPKRLFMSLFLTDEFFAIIMTNDKKVTFKYYVGLVILPYIAWTLGSLTGGMTHEFLPKSLQSAMGIALYAMFIGIIIPPAKKSKSVMICISISALFSCIFYFVPYLNKIPTGFQVVIATVISATICSLLFPVSPAINDRTEYVRELPNKAQPSDDKAGSVNPCADSAEFEEVA